MILAQAAILRVHGDPYNEFARSELVRRAERASINMEEVKECRFLNVEITQNGIKTIEKPIAPPVQVE